MADAASDTPPPDPIGLLEGLRTTRAIRRLRKDPVPSALIRKVCEAGTFAPSGGNRQPWFFIAVTEAERRAFVAERYRAAFARYIAPALAAAEDPAYPDAQRKNRVRLSSPASKTSCSPAVPLDWALHSPRSIASSVARSMIFSGYPSTSRALRSCRLDGQKAATVGPTESR
jgi:nitroreductase